VAISANPLFPFSVRERNLASSNMADQTISYLGAFAKLIEKSLASPYVYISLIFLCFILPFLQRPSLWNIPGPLPAKFSNLWLMYQCRRGRRYLAVHEAHEKYGAFVRIQPHHVSIADVDAIQIVYGHGNGFLKSEYYDAFVSIVRGLFNTRDRAEHSRKRKIISHTFSAKSIGQFEQYMVRTKYN
jgi:benzoate 4-monooxygenase